MGNQKFKLSDMIPNAWFFKLKDMSTKPPPIYSKANKSKKHRLPPPPPPPSSPPSSTIETTTEPPQCQPRKSYHITRELSTTLQSTQDPPISPPRKSKSKKNHTRRNATVSAATTHHHQRQFSMSSSVSMTTTDDSLSTPTPTVTKPERFDIVIDFELPRIVTKHKEQSKPTKVISSYPKDNNHKLISRSPPSRRFSVSSPGGVRLKINSPRIMARKQGQNGNYNGRRSVSSSSSASWRKRRSISESFAVVKSSRDPQKDFRESMVEMIVQNNLRGSKDLEDLLACYLSLNSDEYHAVIIKVFKQIWFDLIHLRQKKCVS